MLLELCNTLSSRSSVTTINTNVDTIVCKLIYGHNTGWQNNFLFLLVQLADLASATVNKICYNLSHFLTSVSSCQRFISMFVYFNIIIFSKDSSFEVFS